MKPNELLGSLFPSRARRDLLRVLFAERLSGSASELARRVGVTPRSARLVLRELEGARLVACEGVGPALIFRAREEDRVVRALKQLFLAAETETLVPHEKASLEAALAYYGAPLLRETPAPTQRVEAAIAGGAKQARKDPTLFRTLPIVILRHWRNLDWDSLRDCSVRANSKSEVGLLLDLTAVIAGLPELSRRAKAFEDDRRSKTEFFFEPQNEFDERLARRRTPDVARKWKFLMNMDLDSLRSTVARHETTAAE